MAAASDDVTRAEVARTAYEIAQTDEAGTDEENWHRAEQELRAKMNESAPSPTQDETQS